MAFFPFLVAGFILALGIVGFGTLYVLFRISVFLPLVAGLFVTAYIPLSVWMAMPFVGVLLASLLAFGAMRFLGVSTPRQHSLKGLLAFLSLLATYCQVTLFVIQLSNIEQLEDSSFVIVLMLCALSNIVVHLVWREFKASRPASNA